MDAGIDAVYTLDGRLITEGIILNDENKSVKPCPVDGKCVLFVDEYEGVLKAVKRN